MTMQPTFEEMLGRLDKLYVATRETNAALDELYCCGRSNPEELHKHLVNVTGALVDTMKILGCLMIEMARR